MVKSRKRDVERGRKDVEKKKQKKSVSITYFNKKSTKLKH
jgi:hypothetical protein